MKTGKENAVIKCDNFEQLKDCREKLIRFGFKDDNPWNETRLRDSLHKDNPGMNFIFLDAKLNNIQIHSHQCESEHRVYLHYSELDSYLEKTYVTDFDNPTEEQKELIRYWIERFNQYLPHPFTSLHSDFIEKHLSPKQRIENNTWYFIERPEHYKQTSNEKPALIFTYSTGYWYGFCHSGEWTNMYGKDISLYKVTKATEQEVSERLIDEAKRRGYKEGITVKSALNGYICDTYGSLSVEKNEVKFRNVTIMKDGKWAEIIDDKAEVK